LQSPSSPASAGRSCRGRSSTSERAVARELARLVDEHALDLDAPRGSRRAQATPATAAKPQPPLDEGAAGRELLGAIVAKTRQVRSRSLGTKAMIGFCQRAS
jgi:hypothetical protein